MWKLKPLLAWWLAIGLFASAVVGIAIFMLGISPSLSLNIALEPLKAAVFRLAKLFTVMSVVAVIVSVLESALHHEPEGQFRRRVAVFAAVGAFMVWLFFAIASHPLY